MHDRVASTAALNLTECLRPQSRFNICNPARLQGLAKLEGVRLRKLALAECVGITDAGIEVMMKLVSTFDLDSTEMCLSILSSLHQSLLLAICQILCKNVRCLENIDVSHCAALTQQAIGAISYNCRGLNTLRVAGCPEVRGINALEVF